MIIKKKVVFDDSLGNPKFIIIRSTWYFMGIPIASYDDVANNELPYIPEEK